jgi:hypothetical protein
MLAIRVKYSEVPEPSVFEIRGAARLPTIPPTAPDMPRIANVKASTFSDS